MPIQRWHSVKVSTGPAQRKKGAQKRPCKHLFSQVDEEYQKAIDNGATSLLEPTTEPWGQRTCFIADPEGNIIEIGSWNKPYEEKDKK